MSRRPSRRQSRPAKPRRRPTRSTTRRKPTDPDTIWTVSALDGVQDLVRAEIENRFGRDCVFLDHPRTDEIHFRYSGTPERLLSLKTAQTLHIRMDFDIARPRTLLSPEHVNALAELMARAGRIGDAPKNGIRFDAAGSGSPTMQRLADHLVEKTGLRFSARHGDCLLTLRPGESGWEILCRVGNRPLATRSWREVNYKGSLNAGIAACMVELTQPKIGDRYLNLMSGSGTLMIERLLRMRARTVVGIDNSEKATDACVANVEASGFGDRTQVIRGDARSTDLPDASFNVITSDLPYGEKLGERETNVDLYRDVLLEADRLCRSGGRLVFLSQDIGALSTVLDEMRSRWTTLDERRIVQRDFRPLCVSLKKNPK